MMRGAGRVAGRSIEGVFSVHDSRLPAPLIVPGAVVEVQERVDASGKVVAEMDTDAAVGRITRMIAEYQLDSVAVALLWSFANPAHEKALAQAIPEVFVSRSSEVSPRLGEYERTVATVLNGYVGPASSRYLSELESRLATPLLVMQSSGGVLPASAATPLGTINSGPAGGLIGVASLAGAYGHDHVVGTDMGGTSFDLGLVIDGKPVVAEQNVIDQYTYRLPNLDVRSIAAGGGSIAWFDEATGGLRVGPASAGSEPGPACYGRGGAEPTVTDADVVLGLVRADTFLDGRMPLDRDAAVTRRRPARRAARPDRRGDRGGHFADQQHAGGDGDPTADARTRPRSPRLRPVRVRRRGPGARLRVCRRIRGPRGRDPAWQRRIHALGVRHRFR